MHYLAPLTSLRFFAAFSIFCFHMQGAYGLGKPYEPLATGVSFFFVLSGFILAYVYGRPGQWNPGSFFVHRLARIWPIHIVTFLIALYLYAPGMIYDRTWYPLMAANFFLVHAWIPAAGFVFSFNAVSWSISAELAFYICFPLFLRTGHPRVVYAAAFLATVLILGALDHYFQTPLSNPDPWGFSAQQFLQQGPILRMLEFIPGVMTGRYFLAGGKINVSRPTASILEVGSLVLVVIFAITSGPMRWIINGAGFPILGLWYSQSGGFLVFAVLIFVFAQGAGSLSKALAHRWLLRLGEASFAFYMIHLMVIIYAKAHQWSETLGEAGAVAAIVGCTLGGSLALWRYVEVPMRRYLVRTWENRRGGRQARQAVIADSPK